MKRSFPVFLLYLCIAQTGFPQSGNIELDAPVVFPADDLLYLEKKVNLDLVARQELVREFLRNRRDFVPLEKLPVDPEKNESAYWVLFSVQNGTDDEKRYFAELGKGYFWKANLFVLAGDGALLSEGDYSVLSGRFDRDRLLPRVSFPFSVPPGEQRHLLFRVKAYDIAKVPFRLVEMQRYLNGTFAAHIIIGILFGILGSLLIYNTALFFSIRERWLFSLLCTIVSAAIYIMTSTKTVPLFYHAPSVFGVLTLAGILFFTRSFLQTAKQLKVVNFLIIGHIAVLPLGIVILPFDGVAFLDTLHSVTVMSAAAVMLVAGVAGVARKERQAWVFLSAFVLFCAGVVTSQLNQFGVRYGAATFFLSRAEQPGFAVSLLLLSVAVSGRVKTMRAAMIKAERASIRAKEEHRQKVDFFAEASHELRTPLANLQLPLERIMRGEEGKTVSAGNSIFRQMHRQTKKLTRHVENLLTISKIEALPEKLRREHTDLHQLCRECAANFRFAVEQKGLVLRFENKAKEGCYAEIDRRLIETAVLNLLDNAVKYTAEGTISLSLASSDTSIRMEVNDTGPGMQKEDVEKVLTRYYTTGKQGSFGIGLAVVSDIVHLHGGSLDIAGVPGRGTKVVIELPASVHRYGQKDDGDHAATAGAPLQKTGAAVLIVEDDPDMINSLCRILEPHFRTSTARNGREGLLQLSEAGPELIISDVMMPEMNGFEFIKAVRERESTAAVPFIFLTAVSSDEDILKGLQYGAVDYIRKPFDRDVLLEKVRSILGLGERYIKDYDRRFREYLRDWKPFENKERDGRVSAEKAGINLPTVIAAYKLTDKQAEVLELVIKGYTNSEIADFLEISKKTVDNHVSAILKKTGVGRRTQLSFEMLQE